MSYFSQKNENASNELKVNCVGAIFSLGQILSAMDFLQDEDKLFYFWLSDEDGVLDIGHLWRQSRTNTSQLCTSWDRFHQLFQNLVMP
jgi:hypothetical protein